jgi:hypothetical protein
VPPSGPDRPLTADEADRIDAADARDQDATEIEPSVAPGEGATTALAGDGSDTPVMRVVTDDDAARVGVHESDADDETADPDDAVGEGADETATLPDASPAFTASSTSGASAVGMAGRVRGRLPRARDVTTATTGGTATAATDQLPYVDDRVSRFWVLAIAATFAAILLYGLMLGRGGFLTPIAAPTPTLAPTPSPVVSPSPVPERVAVGVGQSERLSERVAVGVAVGVAERLGRRIAVRVTLGVARTVVARGHDGSSVGLSLTELDPPDRGSAARSGRVGRAARAHGR